MDNSRLNAIATCSTWTALRYVLGLAPVEEPGGTLPRDAGTLVHAVLAAHWTGRVGEAEAAWRLYRQQAEQAGEPEDGRLHPRSVEKVLSDWLRRIAPTFPFRVPAERVEEPFSVPLASHVSFVGRRDALGQAPAGDWWVVDHKTTGRVDERWRRKYKTASQVTGYTWAANQQLGEPVTGCVINAVVLPKLPSDPRRKKCGSHGVPYAECDVLHAQHEVLVEQRGPQQLGPWQAAAVQLAERFDALAQAVREPEDILRQAVPMEGQFSLSCGDCPAMDWCRLGRPMQLVGSMFQAQPWEPFAQAFQQPQP